MTDPVSNPDASDEMQADPTVASAESDRGRHADSPIQIPAKGWRDILTRVRLEAKDDHVSLLAAGVAFYSLLAAVPALVAVISIYGLIADPADIGEQVVDALAAAPAEVRDLVSAQLESIAGSSSGATLFAALLGVVLALWSASSGVGHLIDALNVAYDESERRGFVERKLLALAFTVGAIAFVVVAFGAIAILPALVADTGLGGFGRVLVGAVRWVVLFAGTITGLSLMYRYGPDRDEPKWRWTSPGAVLAAVLWIAGSLLFSLYTANFAKYNDTYGSLGAIVVVMLWLFLTATVVIVGAEVNAELERQTLSDTTKGPSRPLGQRDAYAADTVGESAEQLKAARADT